MRDPLWTPSDERKQQANITRFIEQINAWYGLNLDLVCGALSMVC